MVGMIVDRDRAESRALLMQAAERCGIIDVRIFGIGGTGTMRSETTRPAVPVFKKISEDSYYEIMEPIYDTNGVELGSGDFTSLSASFTPSNGIRLHIHRVDSELEDYDGTEEFDLEPEEAIALGEALIRWGKIGY